MSQEDLAMELEVSYQQIQKYERGENRIAPSKLLRLAKLLQVPLEEFFKGVAATEPVANALPSAKAIELAVKIEALPPASFQAVSQLISTLAAGKP